MPSLVALLREHAWGDGPAQAQLHAAQSKGLEQLTCLAHRWSLHLLHERFGNTHTRTHRPAVAQCVGSARVLLSMSLLISPLCAFWPTPVCVLCAEGRPA